MKLKSEEEIEGAARGTTFGPEETVDLIQAVFNLATVLGGSGYRKAAEENIPENIRKIFYEDQSR